MFLKCQPKVREFIGLLVLMNPQNLKSEQIKFGRRSVTCAFFSAERVLGSHVVRVHQAH